MCWSPKQVLDFNQTIRLVNVNDRFISQALAILPSFISNYGRAKKC